MKDSGNINLAKNIAELRKEMGLTQEELAQKLFVSGKTVSKWERNAGYPELPQLLKIAGVFGVSVDSLLCKKQDGIVIAGNIILDVVKMVKEYPEKQMLASISSVERAFG